MPLFSQTPPPQPSFGDKYDADREGAHIRATADTQAVLENLINLLAPYSPQLMTDATTGYQYWVLANPLGNANLSASNLGDYAIYDASDEDGPAIGVTPGNHIDGTGGATWIPTLNGNPIAPVPSPPDPAPSLSVSPDDNVAYFKITTNPQDGSGTTPAGAITAIEINTGSSVPNNDNTTVYQIVGFFTVTEDDDGYHVTPNGGGVSGSQVYQYCGGALFGSQ